MSQGGCSMPYSTVSPDPWPGTEWLAAAWGDCQLKLKFVQHMPVGVAREWAGATQLPAAFFTHTSGNGPYSKGLVGGSRAVPCLRSWPRNACALLPDASAGAEPPVRSLGLVCLFRVQVRFEKRLPEAASVAGRSHEVSCAGFKLEASRMPESA
jgi:hypothetical protein